MMTADKRLWLDCHNHIRSHAPDGGPCDIVLDDILHVLDGSEADLRWICAVDFPEMARLKDEPSAVLWANEGLHELIAPARGRLFGACIVHAGAVEQSREALDLFVGERGFVQVGEVHGPAWGPEIDCPQMLDLVRHAAKLGAPVQIDCPMGSPRATSRIHEVLNLARAVPEANLIAAHTIAGDNSYANILAGETYFADGGENVYFEISDFSRRDYVRAAYERLGPDRLIVGTDWHTYGDPPVLPYGILR
ncbi:MAG: amidohydrolase family protein, partial [Armatimonadota bacterium]